MRINLAFIDISFSRRLIVGRFWWFGSVLLTTYFLTNPTEQLEGIIRLAIGTSFVSTKVVICVLFIASKFAKLSLFFIVNRIRICQMKKNVSSSNR